MSSSSPTSTIDHHSGSDGRPPSTISSSTELTVETLGDKRRLSYITSDTDSDKDLVIHSLHESLHIHKEIVEKIHAEKEAYVTKMLLERQVELDDVKRVKQTLEEQMDRYNKLDAAYSALRRELDTKKDDYQRMETRFYAHVKSIKATDDDLSTIQHEISHVSSQLNNLCMGLKAKMDQQSGSSFLFNKYNKQQQGLIRKYLIKTTHEEQDYEGDDNDDGNPPLLEPRYVTMLTEKLIMELLVENIFDQPLHIGVSVNQAYDQVSQWMRRYNEEWAQRFRQQMSALLANQAKKQEGDEGKSIELAMGGLVNTILEQLGHIYPELQKQDSEYRKNQQKKIQGIVARMARLDMAIKGQDVEIKYQCIQEGGQVAFDPTTMKADGKGKPDGQVLFVITPPFVAIDPNDNDHGFITPGKVAVKQTLYPSVSQDRMQQQQQQQQQQIQNSRFLLPSIPHNLVQPLRDALPKIDKALLSSVPTEALPLCQQLFNAWLSASTGPPEPDLVPPPRAKTTMNIASFYQSTSTFSSSLSQLHQFINKPATPQPLPPTTAANQHCRKSHSTRRLSSWFSWTFPKRRNPSVAPAGPKMLSANQNISEIASINAKTDTLLIAPPPKVDLHTQHLQCQQQEHDSRRPSSTCSSLPSSTSTSTPSVSRSILQRPGGGGSTGYRRSVSFMLSRLGIKVRKMIQSSSQRIQPQLKSSSSHDHSNATSGTTSTLKESFSFEGKEHNGPALGKLNPHPPSSPPPTIPSMQLLSGATEEHSSNLPPRHTITASKTDTNMKHEISVPFIKIGLGKRTSLDVDDQVQYTSRSISSTSFALQWQEKFHDQQQPQERLISTLKSVSVTLYDIIQHNHVCQQFNSDTTYVGHPDLRPGEDAQELFSTLPVSHWQDIFDQMAYIYENGILTAEHAIITVIYIERMLENSKQHLCEANWRLIVFAGLLTSIKVWDDCAVHNMDFVRIFPELDIEHVNLIERRFLEHIDWDVSVRCSLFASTYFELRDHR